MFTREQAKMVKWLNSQIKATKIRNTDYNDNIKLCSCWAKEIHIYKGLKDICAILGIDYKTEFFKERNYTYELSFMFKGYRFFEIKKGEE